MWCENHACIRPPSRSQQKREVHTSRAMIGKRTGSPGFMKRIVAANQAGEWRETSGAPVLQDTNTRFSMCTTQFPPRSGRRIWAAAPAQPGHHNAGHHLQQQPLPRPRPGGLPAAAVLHRRRPQPLYRVSGRRCHLCAGELPMCCCLVIHEDPHKGAV